MMKRMLAASFTLAALSVLSVARAQTPAPAPSAAPAAASPAATLVLVPYEEPQSTDPHAVAVTKTLTDDLSTAGIAVTAIAPMDHVDAVAQAAQICAQQHASALLIPDGRYEQTLKRLSISFFLTVLKYPTHAEFRLDEVGCDGAVRWSTTATGDQTASGVDSVGNVGAAVDGAFTSAVQTAVTAFAAARTTSKDTAATTTSAAPADPAASPSALPTNILLLPFAQPGIADPRADDITNALAQHLTQHQLTVKTGTVIDHLTAVAAAQQLCTANGVTGILVPNVRLEQSEFSGHSHAVMRMELLDCKGEVIGHGFDAEDVHQALVVNFGAAAVRVAKQSMDPAIAQLYPAAGATPAATASPSP